MGMSQQLFSVKSFEHVLLFILGSCLKYVYDTTYINYLAKFSRVSRFVTNVNVV